MGGGEQIGARVGRKRAGKVSEEGGVDMRKAGCLFASPLPWNWGQRQMAPGGKAQMGH